MAAAYRIKCINSTDTPYHFGVYQTFPNSPGLKSIAWQVRGLPPKGSIPSTSDICWTLNYGVSIAGWDKDGQVYTGGQVVAAEPGSTYNVVMAEGNIPTIHSVPTGTTSPGAIRFENATHQALDMGFTIDGSLIAVQKVSRGETITCDVHPNYYVAAFRSIKKGEIVDSVVGHGPVRVKYVNGYQKCEVERADIANEHALKDPVYVSNFKAFAHPELNAAAQASIFLSLRVSLAIPGIQEGADWTGSEYIAAAPKFQLFQSTKGSY